uniref:Sesquipedalian n=1 Tax=Equus caballus TaxID=9796 RepID=A0A3Q2GVE8_HORSE
MKLNERSLASYATSGAPADRAGFLFQRAGRAAAYLRRWFVLRGNMLFYFEDAASREPAGVVILEGCTVELVEAAEEFAFAVRFAGARARAYELAAESQAALEGWVKALSRASFDYLRLVVRELERQLAAVRGPAPAPPARALPRRPPRPAPRPGRTAAPPGAPRPPPRPAPRPAAAPPPRLGPQRARRLRAAARELRPRGARPAEPLAAGPRPALSAPPETGGRGGQAGLGGPRAAWVPGLQL